MEQGRFLLFTGDGKGKSTAAFGLAARALGHGQKVCIVQFFKSEDFETGEFLLFKKLGVEIIPCGCGFTWKNSAEKNRESIRCAYEIAREKLQDKTYDLVILDEICNVFSISGFETDDVCPISGLIKLVKEAVKDKNVVATGRGAPRRLKAAADLMTEMRAAKHYYDKGVTAQKGLEY